jgi:hypothetical protein
VYVTSFAALQDPEDVKSTYGADVQFVFAGFLDACLDAGQWVSPQSYLIASDASEASEPKEEAMKEPPAKKPRKGKKAAAIVEEPLADVSNQQKDDVEAPVENIVIAVKKGAAVIDHHCPVASRCHVYAQGQDVYGTLTLQKTRQSDSDEHLGRLHAESNQHLE